MAVYTAVSEKELDTFVTLYDIGDLLAAEGIAEGVENSNYLLSTTQGSFILTLYEKRVKPSDLPFFLALKEHLTAKGVACPSPVRACDGNVLQSLCGRPAAIFTFLDGTWPHLIKLNHCAQLGAALAELHLAGADFSMSRDNDLSVHSWRSLLMQSAPGAEKLQPGLFVELEDEISVLETQWPVHLPTGIIHADLFPDNVFFSFGKLSGLIDFYFACTDMLAYDIAICLNAWCFDANGSFNYERSRILWAAYSGLRPLSLAEKKAMPILARGAATRFLLTRLFDWLNTPQDALVNKKDPIEYRNKLRFHQSVNEVADYGFD